MANQESEVIFRFTPQFPGAFLRGVPKRDLTQRDVDRLDAMQRRDALSPHPGYGTPLYTAVEGRDKKAQEKAITAFERAEKSAEKADGDA